MSTEQKYWIWSIEHQAWWKPQSNGYTNSLGFAGVYNENEILFLQGQRQYPKDIAIPCPPLSASPTKKDAQEESQSPQQCAPTLNNKCPYCANPLTVVISRNENF